MRLYANITTMLLLSLILIGCLNNHKTSVSELDAAIDSLILTYMNKNQSQPNNTNDTSIKHLSLNSINDSILKYKFGPPELILVDTFKYGVRQTTYGQILNDNRPNYYDSKFEKIPNIITHKFIWSTGDSSAISLICAQNSKDRLIPIQTYRIKYSSMWIPLWSLPEKEYNIQQLISLNGEPSSEKIDTLKYGTKSGYLEVEDIDKLRDKPQAILHLYEWPVDSTHFIRIFFDEEDNNPKKEPIWGYLYDWHNLSYE